MSNIIGLIILVAAAIFLFHACEEDWDAEQKKILAFYKHNKTGDQPAYGLYSSGHLVKGEYLTGTIFGMSDNRVVCQEIADFINRKERENIFYCAPIN